MTKPSKQDSQSVNKQSQPTAPVSDAPATFEAIRAAYLASDEMSYKKSIAEWLEREIKTKRVDSPEHLANQLAELTDYPLSETIILFICYHIMGFEPIRPTEYLNALAHAKMICTYIPVYEKALARYQRMPPSDIPPRDRAVERVFREVMREEGVDKRTIIDRMSRARKFARENGVAHYLDETRGLNRWSREALIDELMAEL